MDAARATPAAAGRLLAGDPLRGLATLGIAVYHAGTVSLDQAGHLGDLQYGWPTPFGKLAGGLIGAGANAVGVFLVLSGYLISRPFISALAEGRRLPPILAYLRNRVLRIVPGYWVALAAVLFVAGAQGASWSDAPRLLGFSEDWYHSPLRFDLGQAWTLGVEARYYLAVPLVAGLILLASRLSGGRPRGRGARLWLVGTTALACAATSFIVFPRGTTQEVFQIPAQAHLLLLGVVLAAADLGGGWRWLATRPGRVAALGGFALGVVPLVWMQYPYSPWADIGGLDFLRSTSMVSSIAALLIVGIPVLRQRGGAGCWRLLDNRPLRWLGTRSYGFYVYQLLVLTELAHHAPTPGLYRRTFVFLIVVGLPLITLLAAVSWRLVERPALRWKASTRPQAALTPAGAPAVAATGS